MKLRLCVLLLMLLSPLPRSAGADEEKHSNNVHDESPEEMEQVESDVSNNTDKVSDENEISNEDGWKDVNNYEDSDEDNDEDSDEDDDENPGDVDDDSEKVAELNGSSQSDEPLNPCLKKRCRRGEVCMVKNDSYSAQCVCRHYCLPGRPEDDRFQVCSKRNITYDSECALDRDHCLCRRHLDGCSDPQLSKIRLDYFGHCQELQPCSEHQMREFPSRIREWLYAVMKELVDREEIPQYLDLVEHAAQDSSRSHAVLWKFCDLDTSHDRVVSRRELVYTIQTLKALENCLMPFLNKCDSDSDNLISLQEWGTCLGLRKNQIADICKAVHQDQSTSA